MHKHSCSCPHSVLDATAPLAPRFPTPYLDRMFLSFWPARCRPMTDATGVHASSADLSSRAPGTRSVGRFEGARVLVGVGRAQTISARFPDICTDFWATRQASRWSINMNTRC